MRLMIPTLLLFCTHFYAQKVKRDSVYLTKEKERYSLNINSKSYPILLDESPFDTSVDCKYIDDSFDLVVQIQNGNQYEIFHNFFMLQNGQYIRNKSYLILSDRNEYSLYGKIPSQSHRNEFIGLDNFFDGDKSINIQNILGLQDSVQQPEYSLLSLAKHNYSKGNFKNVAVLTDPFVIKELNVLKEYNVQEINDIAYYAYKSGNYKEAIFILQNLIKKYPQREVAYLNLADSQWEINDKVNAIKNYNKYIELMQKENKKEKIPDYVRQRI